MQLLDENYSNKKNNKKLKITILVSIIVLFIIMLILIITMLALKEKELIVTLDGNKNAKIGSLLVFDGSNTNKIYVPIREIANYLGYKDYSGEYDNVSEVSNKCYVECENEVANFALNSNQIYIKEITNNSDYEVKTIDEPVKAINGKLYTTTDGIEKAFNVSFSYNADKNTVVIYTMPYLIQAYSSKVLDYGYESIAEEFINQKTVLNNMLVVNKEEKYAVIDIEGKAILENKYEKIEYLQNSSDFLVTKDGKVGIITQSGKTKVGLTYDEIKLMDNNKNLYKIKKDGKYGVIDNSGKILIHPEYMKIGIDANQFKENEIKNSYVLLNTLIPVQKGELWGFINISGNQITDFEYSAIGYLEASSTTGSNLLLVPDYDVIIVKKDEKYTAITAKGEKIWPAAFDAIYMTITSGEKEYTMSGNNKTWNLIQKLEEQGIGKKKTKENTNSDNTIDTENTSTNESANTTNKSNNTLEAITQ